jgi:hypothetical protein
VCFAAVQEDVFASVTNGSQQYAGLHFVLWGIKLFII